MTPSIRAVLLCFCLVLITSAVTPLLAGDETRSTTLFPPRSDARLWLTGQANAILQAHASCTSPYSGPNGRRRR